MSLSSVSALQKLFTMPPFTLLLKGSHCTVYVEPVRVRVKDDIENHVQPFDADTHTQNQIRSLFDQVLVAGDLLDVTVNGRDFAITRIPDVVVDGVRGSEFIVTARHRLHKEASSDFKASLVTNV